MKINKLPSGSYNVQKQIDGHRYSLTFDHRPTQKDITLAISDILDSEDYDKKGTMEFYAKEYISNRSAVFSPSTIHTYERLIRSMSDNFRKQRLKDITQASVQKEINLYAKDHAPKSVRSYHGFISTVLKDYRPSLNLHTTLPQKEIKDRYLPTEEDIQRILEAANGSEFSVAFQLGILSCRRSEVSALTLDDLDGNVIHITKNMVYNKKWLVKDTPKTDASHRDIVIPDSLRDEILEQGYIFKYTPPKLNEALHRYQDQLGIPRFRFHDMRVYFASYTSTLIPEADAMAMGGWKSDYIFKQTYRRSMEKSRRESANRIATSIIPKKCI